MAMANTIGGGLGRTSEVREFVLRLRAWIGQRGLLVLGLSVAAAVLVAAAVATMVINTVLDPNVTFVSGELSPNHDWVALTDQVEPGPMMGDADTVIELRHHDGLLIGPTQNREFLMKFRGDKVQIVQMHWYTDDVLEIVFACDPDDTPELIKYYKDVVIDYRRVPPTR